MPQCMARLGGGSGRTAVIQLAGKLGQYLLNALQFSVGGEGGVHLLHRELEPLTHGPHIGDQPIPVGGEGFDRFKVFLKAGLVHER